MSKIRNIEPYFFIYDVENHLQIKDAILSGIDSEPLKPMNSENERIFNANYSRKMHDTVLNKDLDDMFMHLMREHSKEFGKILNYSHIDIKNYWYQQYKYNDYHGWHTHGGVLFSNIYYVDLDSESSPTTFEFLGKEFDIEAKEGQILTFPAFLRHCSKPNKSYKTKTVFVFNTDGKGSNE